jgi:hypothetical protein
MRRFFVLACLLLLATAVVASTHDIASTQETEPTPPPFAEGERLLLPLTEMISGQWEPVFLEPIGVPLTPTAPDLFGAAGISCSAATSISMPVNGQDGGQTVVNYYPSGAEDPNLGACMYGQPSRPQGYRSAWYRFVAPATGTLRVSTEDSDYDTVVAIFSGSCAGLALVACNDDHIGFTSEATAWVIQGQTYFIEVVDWHHAVNATANLRLVAGIKSISQWTRVGNMAEGGARSRHAAVAYGPYIYVIGGQTLDQNNFPVRTKRTDRYNTVTGVWERMDNMPYTCGGNSPSDPADSPGGYSNTTAVLVGTNIYVPSGFNGDIYMYQGNHCVYDIALNRWFPHPYYEPNFFPANAPWPGGNPFAYSASVSYHSPAGYYLLGGITGPAVAVPPNVSHGQPRNEAFFYSAAGNSWSPIAPMQVARYGHVAALQRIANKDLVCVAGGISLDQDDAPILLSGMECYDPSTNSWNTIGTANLNTPRYFAGSAVRGDGRWFVFGGTDQNRNSVATTEMFDPASGTWITLDSRYNLTDPPRSWPRGGFVGNSLWVTGGHWNAPNGDELVINLIERLFLPFDSLFLPFVTRAPLAGRPGSNVLTAQPLAFFQPQHHAFVDAKDYIHFYYFDIGGPTAVTARLTDIPGDSDYNLHIYNQNKGRLTTSANLGSLPEQLQVELIAGRYFVIVERVFPPPGSIPNSNNYRLEITTP